MSDSTRTFDEARTFMKSYDGTSSKDQVEHYDVWGDNYEKDMSLMNFNAPTLAVDCLLSNFHGSHEATLVLDVACGSGLVAKLMSKSGFRHFEGVDGSKSMLDQAAQTGLYQDLRLALLGTEPLPAPPGVFDVVMLVGGLGVGFIPVSIVKELCHATKPGGLICMTRGDHKVEGYDYKAEMEKELKMMEEEGLWEPVEIKVSDKYMVDLHQNHEKDMKNQQDVAYISGSVYLYRKSDKEPESRA